MKIKLFKNHHPYAPVAFIGRKNVEAILDGKILKDKKLRRLIKEQNK